MQATPEHNPGNPSNAFIDRLGQWARNSVILRLLTIVILVLLLLIPMSMIKDLIHDRENRKDDATREIRSKWADEQFVFGPVLTIPYNKKIETQDGKSYTETHYLKIAPEDLAISSKIDPLIKHRGIFKVVLYTASLGFDGLFRNDALESVDIDPASLRLDEAFIAVQTDMVSIRNRMVLSWGDDTLNFRPTIPSHRGAREGVHAALPPLSMEMLADGLPFIFDMDLKGSSALMLAPLGRTTTCDMHSSWPDPSFDGTILPDTHTITADGFDASWKILEFNRRMPNMWIDDEVSFEEPDLDYMIEVESAEGTWFGLQLAIPADSYQQSMRTAKYAILLIVLTFTIFFMIGVLNRNRIHPVQYVLVGLALTLFYSLLLAIAEYTSFGLAYLMASFVIVSVITLYTASIFKSTRLTLITGASLAVLYVYLYVILQQSDIAFLLGNIGLLLALATVMYITRKLDWYSLSQKRTE